MKIKMNKTNEDLTIYAIMKKYKRYMTISNFSDSSIDSIYALCLEQDENILKELFKNDENVLINHYNNKK